VLLRSLAKKAAEHGSNVIAFHECSITGYTFARHLSRSQMLELAEFIPEGESIKALQAIAREYDIIVLAGLFEKDEKRFFV
jgi:predicted amidohydrolase